MLFLQPPPPYAGVAIASLRHGGICKKDCSTLPHRRLPRCLRILSHKKKDGRRLPLVPLGCGRAAITGVRALDNYSSSYQ